MKKSMKTLWKILKNIEFLLIITIIFALIQQTIEQPKFFPFVLAIVWVMWLILNVYKFLEDLKVMNGVKPKREIKKYKLITDGGYARMNSSLNKEIYGYEESKRLICINSKQLSKIGVKLSDDEINSNYLWYFILGKEIVEVKE